MLYDERIKVEAEAYPLNSEVVIRLDGKYEDPTIILTNIDDAERFARKLLTIITDAKKDRDDLNEEMKKYNFSQMYHDFERKYNKYPVAMTPSDAFGRALQDGLITARQLRLAWKYFGKLWNYSGD